MNEEQLARARLARDRVPGMEYALETIDWLLDAPREKEWQRKQADQLRPGLEAAKHQIGGRLGSSRYMIKKLNEGES